MSQGNVVFTNKRSDSLCSVQEIMYSQAHKRITDLYSSNVVINQNGTWSAIALGSRSVLTSAVMSVQEK